MTDEQIEKSLKDFIKKPAFSMRVEWKLKNGVTPNFLLELINRLKADKRRAETQLCEILSALYRQAGKLLPFLIERKDIVELAKDYGIKEEELK